MPKVTELAAPNVKCSIKKFCTDHDVTVSGLALRIGVNRRNLQLWEKHGKLKTRDALALAAIHAGLAPYTN